MSRGGYREGAGRKFKWKSGKTKAIRVPEVLAEAILDYAKKLDDEVVAKNLEKEINLSGINLIKVDGEYAIKLSSLIKVGYLIKPERLADMVLEAIYKNSLR